MAEFPAQRDIFCNRTLNLRAIRAIGYDMDYTLIQYHVAEWERRAYEYAREGLLERGWPVAGLEFDPSGVIQWLTVDLELGNLVKANRFGYVKGAAHGTKPLAYDEMRRDYARTIVDHREPRFKFMSTLFSLSESCLYAQLVDKFDAGELPEVGGYADLYDRVRGAIDYVHAEGRLKAEITANPERFIDLDEDTPLALMDQKASGKKLLLITNSGWPYTSQIMTYAFDPFLPGDMTWRDVFDLVIVSARKPDFFTSRSPIFEIVDDEGRLLPVNGEPERGKAYLGGNAALVEKLFGLRGEQLLYVGDHFFGDVEASKRFLRWRTALIVRELEGELESMGQFTEQRETLQSLMREKVDLESHHCQARLVAQRHRIARGNDEQLAPLKARVEQLRDAIDALDQKIAPLARASSEIGNLVWGPLMRTGNDKSYLARLVERHADIYTSRVSNFLFQTPFKYFRSARGSLPHDP